MQLKYVWIALADEDGKKNSLTGKLRATVNNTELVLEKNRRIEIRDMQEYNNDLAEESLIITSQDSLLEVEKAQAGTAEVWESGITGNTENQTAEKKGQKTGPAILGFGSDYHGKAAYIVLDEQGITLDFLEMVFCRHHKQPVKILETDRLLVREITTGDLEDLAYIYADPSITQFVEPLYAYEEELAFTQAYIKNMYGFYGYGLWLVFEKNSGRLIGRMGLENGEIDGTLEVELGYLVAKDEQRKGYAYECCKAILQYAWEELGIEAVMLCTDPQNTASVNLAKKLGFTIYAEGVGKYDVYRRALAEKMTLN